MGRSGGMEKTSLISLTFGGETDAATHGAKDGVTDKGAQTAPVALAARLLTRSPRRRGRGLMAAR